jgi:hypothetical protein
VSLTLKLVLIIFLAGFLLYRSASVKIAAVACLALGVLLANGWLGDVVHYVDGAFSSLT